MIEEFNVGRTNGGGPGVLSGGPSGALRGPSWTLTLDPDLDPDPPPSTFKDSRL